MKTADHILHLGSHVSFIGNISQVRLASVGLWDLGLGRNIKLSIKVSL